MKRQAIPRTWRTLRKGVTCIPFNDNPWHADDESSIRPETKTGWYKTKKGKTSAWYWRIGRLPSRQSSKQASKQAATDGGFLYGDVSGCRQSFCEMMSVPFDEFLLTIWVFLLVPILI